MSLQIDLKGLTLSPKISLGDFICDSNGELFRISSTIGGKYVLYEVTSNVCCITSYDNAEELLKDYFNCEESIRIIKECDMELSYIGVV